jgi:bifunctional N-acetylglucosamine-1-phosphate-uridyltransferase/glucosamine-1-phosphate-acetyltransferase GlmU-like protein
VRIGRLAMIAAGSNITRDVPANMLAICRTKDVVLKPRPAR